MIPDNVSLTMEASLEMVMGCILPTREYISRTPDEGERDLEHKLLILQDRTPG